MKNTIITTVGIVTLAVGGYLAVQLPSSDSLGADKVAPVSVKSLQDAEYTKTGTYTQVLKGEVGSKIAVPAGTYVNVYEGPTGKGYQVVTEYADRIEYVGYGPQAEVYTYTEIKSTATTTP